MSLRKKKGPEKFLMKELIALIHGQPLPEHSDGLGPEYIYYNDPAGSVGSPGSNNWAMLALACKYIMKESGCEEKVLSVCRANEERYGGRELDSSIYEPFTAGSLWIIQKYARDRGDTEVYNKVSSLNRYRAARYRLFYAEKAKRIVAVGQRSAGSAGSKGGDGWLDVVVKLGLSKYSQRDRTKVLNKARKASYPPMRFLPIIEKDIMDSFDSVKTTRQAIDELKTNKRNSIIPIYYILYSDGFSIIQKKSIHGSTQPVLFGAFHKDKFVYGPKDRGSRSKSRKKGLSKCEFEINGTDVDVIYTSVVYDEKLSIKLELVEMILEIGGKHGFRNITHSDNIEIDENEEVDIEINNEDGEQDESSWSRFKTKLSNLINKLKGVFH